MTNLCRCVLDLSAERGLTRLSLLALPSTCTKSSYPPLFNWSRAAPRKSDKIWVVGAGGFVTAAVHEKKNAEASKFSLLHEKIEPV